MCGIVGYVGPRQATPLLIEGLKRLEYRGYDSAGIAVIADGRLVVQKAAGKIATLESQLSGSLMNGLTGIAHTRWATHGAPTTRNAHPHTDCADNIAVVHNGIIENATALRTMLVERGHKFSSDTDTEVIAHLVERYLSLDSDLALAARKALTHLRGAHGLVMVSTRQPDRIVAARLGNAGGVVIGVGEGEMFVASDIPAILEHTRQMAFLEAGQVAVITRQGFQVTTLDGEPRTLEVQTVPWDPVSAAKGEYKHFMQKEIYEQVRSTTDTIGGRVDFEGGRILLPDLHLTAELAQRLSKIVITGCGTAAHAGMVGKVLIERLAKLPVEVSIASEFRYSEPLVDESTVVLAISQSGETADTLAAIEEAKRRGATVWSIVNVIGSQAMRVADGTISMQAGPEIGVASTKAYTAPLVDLYMLGVLLGELRGTLDESRRRELVRDLRLVPDLVGQCLDRVRQPEEIAWALQDVKHCLYLGRGINMPTAYEGALKLKEISYIHAEGYPAGEMKHGPIALIDADMPIVAIAPRDPWYEKTLSQIEQTKARGGIVIAVASDGDDQLPYIADYVLWVPQTPWLRTR